MMSGKNEASPVLSIRVPLSKIRHYLSTFELTRGFLAALLGSAFIYLETANLSHPLLTTLSGIAALYLLLGSKPKIWLFSGFFTGLLWFWWIGLSFIHYHMPWMIPFVGIAIGGIYGLIFWSIAKTAYAIQLRLPLHFSPLPSLVIKGFGLLIMSYIHPFGFDWFKPEVMFVTSYLGIQKWQFVLILSALILSIWRRNLLFLPLLLCAYSPVPQTLKQPQAAVQIVTTHIPVEEKWDRKRHTKQFGLLFQQIDQAITEKKQLVILPESVFPVFLNLEKNLLYRLQRRANKINIVTGALYWDGKTPRNSTYIFTTDGNIRVAHKVVLVPFGESNPLPDFLSDWVNRIFYDDAVDYLADSNVTDYRINGTSYRNAICFEATSERLYEGEPKQMIVLSNNGWFTPSTEPTLQRLLLQYYSKKYGTTIYHAVNMSGSYMIIHGNYSGYN